jgi:GDPmannose 4,6-dehydratase
MKTIIITGITGQDGSLMADYILRNTDLFVYGAHRRLSVPNHKNIEHLKGHPRFSTIDLDITDPENINQVVRQIKPDYFVNFAANSFVGNSWKMPVNHMQTNCMGVLFCLEAIRNFSPETRFYNAGSSEQFGDVIYSPQDINHPFRPRSPYGAAKCAAHHLVKVYRDSYNIYAVQGILFNHEGVRRGEEFVTRKITKNVARIKNSKREGKAFLPMELGNLDAKRDWSDAEDFVHGVWLMLNQNSPKDYVLSANETHSVREFVELAFKAALIEGEWSGNGIEEVFIDKETKQKLVTINPAFYRPAEVDLLWGDSGPARQELNWTPKTSFEQLVEKMVASDLGWPYNTEWLNLENPIKNS